MKHLLILDQKILPSALACSPFALTDILTEYAGVHNQPLIHFWQMEDTFILGMKDARIAGLKNGLEAILERNYQPVLRNSGGLGVIADRGVLNATLFLPSLTGEKISIDFGYEEMLAVVRLAFGKSAGIDAKEISDSYCPGNFDLSIRNRKFAGLAQRRVKNGVAVMMYLSITGNQAKRGKIVRKFYQTALKESFGTGGFPPVSPESMANLNELLHLEQSVDEVKEKLCTSAKAHLSATGEAFTAEQFLRQNNLTAQYENRLEGMKQRNQNIQSIVSAYQENQSRLPKEVQHDNSI